MTITVVDKRNGFIAHKVSNRDGDVLRYQVFPESKLGDSSARIEAKTLAEAREHLQVVRG